MPSSVFPLRLLYDAAGSIAADGRLMVLNDGVERLLERPAGQHESLIEQPFQALFADDTRSLAGEILRIADEEGHWHGEVFLRGPSAHLIPVYLMVSRVDPDQLPTKESGAPRPSFIFVAFDYAEQHYLVAEHLKRHAIVQRLLKSAPLGMLVFDGSSALVEFNARAQALLTGAGITLEVGQALSDIAAPFSSPLQTALASARDGQVARVLRVPLTDSDGAIVNAEFVPSGKRAGQPENLVLFLEDRTADLRLEDQLRETERFASLGLMAANLAHEINNPLQGLQGAIEHMTRVRLKSRDRLDPAMRKALEALDSELDASAEQCLRVIARMGKLVAPVLDLARHRPPDIAPVNLGVVVHDAIGLMATHPKVINCKVLEEVAIDLPRVETDAAQVQQVLTNLLVNAAHALKGRGTITFTIAREDDTHLAIRVHDNGPGVAPDAAPHLFTPFFTTKPVGEGTGLGLYVSRTVAQRLGGWLEHEATGATGATFKLTLPVHFTGPTIEEESAYLDVFHRRQTDE
ncbi:MAG: ATP-binding protein [bacterium]